jgi:predicted nuclease of predicted toxin-antitoxin system
MKFLADENFPLDSVYILRQRGYDITAIILDSPGIKDTEILFRAIKEERIILTFDKDYGELIFKLKLQPPIGLVLFRYDPSTPAEPAEHLIKLIAIQGFSLSNKFTVIERDNVRQRRLPFENLN